MKGHELRKRRHALKMTQKEFAEMLGVAQNTVARWERDERGIPEPVARLVAYLKPKRTR